MQMQQSRSSRYVALVVGIAVLVLAGVARADPPARVARVGYISGPVSFSPAGEDEWVKVGLNRPVVTGDRLWADAAARVELQIGTAAIRLGASTSVTLLNLDDRVAQFQLEQGTVNLRVRRLDADQVVEIDTPNLAYVIQGPGQYRISVEPDGNATQVHTSSGRAEVYGEGASYLVDAGKSYRFFGTGLRDFEDLPYPAVDDFDRWAQERDRGYDNSISARYVSRDVIGSQDLDAYGSWRAVPEYGNVWTPTRVSSDWVPYRDGHWAWVDPWGWTWVDEAPWGFAVSHYGRWAHIGDRWGWIPGPVQARAVYAPALVAFIGGGNFGVSISSGNANSSAVGWFPLGPRDVYRPAYPVSQKYFTNVNVSNTVINNTYVTNVYQNNKVTNVSYVNQQVSGAVVTVPRNTFVQSQPVARAVLRVPHEEVVRAPVVSAAVVAPTQVSVRGAAPQGAKPPPQARDQRVLARSAPPAAPVAFAARERVLADHPGKPVDASTLATLRQATPVPVSRVLVVAPPPQAIPVAPPKKGEQPAQPRATSPAMPAQPAAQGPAAVVQPSPRVPASAAPSRPETPQDMGRRGAQRDQPVSSPAPVAAQRSQPANPPVPVAAPRAQPVPRVQPAPRAEPVAAPAPPPAPRAQPVITPPAPVAAPAVRGVQPEPQRVRPVPPAAAAPVPKSRASAPATPAVHPPESRPAGGPPKAVPPSPPSPHQQAASGPRPKGEKKDEEAGKPDEARKRNERAP
jgi:hypothetical protein